MDDLPDTGRLLVPDSSSWVMSASTGSSISGPTTSASATSGSSGNAVTAMANATGELRARIVSRKLAESS